MTTAKKAPAKKAPAKKAPVKKATPRIRPRPLGTRGPLGPAPAALARFEADWVKEWGPDSLSTPAVHPVEVVTFGSLALDVASGVHGMPVGKIIEVVGPGDSGKTTLAMINAANNQQQYPHRLIGWIDVERSWNDQWAQDHGVDLNRVRLTTPLVVQDVADQVKTMARSGLFSMIVIDSIGGMIGRSENEKEADEVAVAEVARVVTRMVKQQAALCEDNAITLWVINQPRCIRRGTRISTDRGLIPIESVRVGDMVNSDTDQVQVIGTSDSGRMSGRELGFADRASLWISDNHRQIVVGPDGQPMERSGEQVVVGDWVMCPTSEPTGWGVESPAPALVAYLGAHFADGTIYSEAAPWSKNPRMRRLSIGERNSERRQIVLDLMIEVFGDAVRPMGKWTYQVSSKHLVEWISSLGVGGRNDDKKIPEVIFQGTSETIRQFLKYASFDTHGFARGRDGFVWSGTNLAHVSGIASLLRRVGVQSSLHPPRRKQGWHLTITGTDAVTFRDQVGFAEPSKMRRAAVIQNSFGARGKHDVVPPQVVSAVFGLARRMKVPAFTTRPHYGALNMVMYQGLNGSRERLLEFCQSVEDVDPQFKMWSRRLTETRYQRIDRIETAEFDAVDLEVDGGLFVADGILTHNSNIGGGPKAGTTTGGGFALKHASAIKLDLRLVFSEQRFEIGTGDDKVEVGIEIAARFTRNKFSPKKVAKFVLLHTDTDAYGPMGIDRASECFVLGTRTGVIAQPSTGYYQLPDRPDKIHGKARTLAALWESPALVDDLRTQILAVLAEQREVAEQALGIVTETTPSTTVSEDDDDDFPTGLGEADVRAPEPTGVMLPAPEDLVP